MSVFRNHDLILVHNPGEWVKGRWVKGEQVSIPFKGTAQPATGKVLEWLPDGKRSSESILVFAPRETVIKTANGPETVSLEFTSADPEKKVSGDIIVWKNRRYEVQVVKDYDMKGEFQDIDHWELVAIRDKEGQS